MTTTDLARIDPEAVAEMLGIEPMPVTAADMAWMAGIIDVKGAVIRKNNKTRRTPQVVLYVQTKEERIARRLSALTGTAPEPHDRKPPPEEFLRRNCVEHCTTPHIHVGDGEYPWQMPATTRWALTGIAAAVVLMNLAPYMSTYADYAADVAGIISSFATEGQGVGAVRKALLRLNSLGWQIPPAVTVRLAEGSTRA
jgi:hypothetical protein